MPLKTQPFIPPQRARGQAASATQRIQRLQKLPHAGRVLGLDPGLHRTGYGIIDCGPGGGSQAIRLVEGGVLNAPAAKPFEQRLQALFDGLTEVLREYRPDVVVVEELFSTYAHPRSALLMAHARGVLLLAAGQAGAPVHSFLPNEVKQVLTGNGHALKSAVQAAVRARLHLAAPPQPPDVADALAIAICLALRQQAVERLSRR